MHKLQFMVSYLRSAGLFGRTTKKLETLELCTVGSRLELLDLA